LAATFVVILGAYAGWNIILKQRRKRRDEQNRDPYGTLRLDDQHDISIDNLAIELGDPSVVV